MAFVNRTDREWPRRAASTSATVGPGSYQVGPRQTTASTRISYAPFSSSSERGTGDKEPVAGYTPGPGSYERTAPMSREEHHVSTAAFLNNVGRFSHKGNANPGPGSYNERNTWRPKKSLARSRARARHHPQSGAKQVQWLRVSSAPSIPNRAQSYGYEENKAGDLVLQPHPAMGQPGQAHGVGPGSYDVGGTSKKFGNSKGLTDWSKSKASRLPESKKTATATPGPGNYKHDVEPKRSNRQSSVFSSKTNRIKSKVSAVPGPGHYGDPVADSAFNAEPTNEYYQFFGSRSTRLGGQGAREHKSGPGPGAYDVATSTFKGGDPADPGEVRAQTPFKSTEARFTASAGARREHEPGPGAYTGSSNIAAELNKKRFGRNQTFGSTTDRFAGGAGARPATAAATPGPGSYTEKKLVKQVRPSSSFSSSASRFRKKPSNSNPEPGAYEVSNFNISTTNGASFHASSVFSSTSARSNAHKAGNAWLGPGTYNTAVSRPHTPGIGASSFTSANPRFKSAPATKVPGPGHYTEDISDNSSLVKRSYNITVADGS